MNGAAVKKRGGRTKIQMSDLAKMAPEGKNWGS